MPVQILPYIETPLQQLAPHIQQGAQALGMGLGQYQRRQADAPILQQLQSGQVSPSQFTTLWGQLSESARKKYEPFLQSHLRTQETQAREEVKQNVKSQAKEKEKIAKEEQHAGLLNDLEDLKPYAGSTQVPFTKSFFGGEGGLNREAIEKRAEIDTMAISLEGVLREMATKGALPKATFEILLSKIPSSKDSERTYQGKINAFRKILKTSPREVQKTVSGALNQSSGKTVKVISPNTGLPIDIPEDQVQAAIASGGKLA